MDILAQSCVALARKLWTIQKPRRELSSGTRSACILILDFPTFRVLRNESLLFKLPYLFDVVTGTWNDQTVSASTTGNEGRGNLGVFLLMKVIQTKQNRYMFKSLRTFYYLSTFCNFEWQKLTQWTGPQELML